MATKRAKTSVSELPPVQFEDSFVVRSVDSSKFERVSRIRGKSSGFDAELVLDVNTDIFPIAEQETLTLALALRLTNAAASSESAMTHKLTAASGPTRTLMDAFDYVMHGKVFKLEEKSSARRSVYISFSGLLMCLTADKQIVGELVLDSRIFLLLKRAE